MLQTHYAYFLAIARSGRYFLIDVPGAMQPWSIDTPDRDYASGISRVEDVSEVLVCYALRVSESPSNLQRNRVTS